MIANRKFDRLQRFIEETPFHGYGLAGRAFSWYELGTWLLMILVCSILTTVQSISLVNYYLNEPTATTVTVTQNNSIILDKAVLCFELTTTFQVTTDTSYIQQLLDTTDFSSVTSTANTSATANWDNELVYLFTQMILEVTLIEYGSVQFEWGRVSPTTVSSPLNNAMNQVYSYLRGKNVKFDRLLKVTGALACTLLNVTVTSMTFSASTKQMNPTEIQICVPENLLSFSVNGLCLKVADANGTLPNFATSNDYLQISANPENFHRQVDRAILATMSTRLDLLGRIAKGVEMGGTVVLKYLTTTAIAATLQAIYQLQNLRRRPCSNTITTSICHITCTANFIYSHCNCWPMCYASAIPIGSNIPICTETGSYNATGNGYYLIPRYSECAKNLPKSDTASLSVCHHSCLNDCQYNKFSFTARPLVGPSGPNIFTVDTGKNATVMKLQVEDLLFPYFEETLENSWQSFLSEFGGTIGLWLGGSIIAMIHVPMFLLKTGVELAWKHKKATTKATQVPVNIYN